MPRCREQNGTGSLSCRLRFLSLLDRLCGFLGRLRADCLPAICAAGRACAVAHTSCAAFLAIDGSPRDKRVVRPAIAGVGACMTHSDDHTQDYSKKPHKCNVKGGLYEEKRKTPARCRTGVSWSQTFPLFWTSRLPALGGALFCARFGTRRVPGTRTRLRSNAARATHIGFVVKAGARLAQTDQLTLESIAQDAANDHLPDFAVNADSVDSLRLAGPGVSAGAAWRFLQGKRLGAVCQAFCLPYKVGGIRCYVRHVLETPQLSCVPRARNLKSSIHHFMFAVKTLQKLLR
jgi:hypothetical protein